MIENLLDFGVILVIVELSWACEIMLMDKILVNYSIF